VHCQKHRHKSDVPEQRKYGSLMGNGPVTKSA